MIKPDKILFCALNFLVDTDGKNYHTFSFTYLIVVGYYTNSTALTASIIIFWFIVVSVLNKRFVTADCRRRGEKLDNIQF